MQHDNLLPAVIGALALGLVATKVALEVYRSTYLRDYEFPSGLRQRLAQRFPGYSRAQWNAVFDGLRQWFTVLRKAGDRPVAMPSRAVDEAWHEFILDTRRYDAFCRRAFGRFVHHRPAEPMRDPQRAQDGIRRAWRLACELEGIAPKRPTRIPLLFALDATLGFPGGHPYRIGATPPPADDRDREIEFDAGAIGCASDGGSGGGDGGCGGGCGGD